MRKTRKVVKTEPREVEETVCIVCDLCGAESPSPSGWSHSIYSKTEVKFKCLDIESYPGDYHESGYKVDFCPNCGKKVMDKLIEMGVKKEDCEYDSHD